VRPVLSNAYRFADHVPSKRSRWRRVLAFVRGPRCLPVVCLGVPLSLTFPWVYFPSDHVTMTGWAQLAKSYDSFVLIVPCAVLAFLMDGLASRAQSAVARFISYVVSACAIVGFFFLVAFCVTWAFWTRIEVLAGARILEWTFALAMLRAAVLAVAALVVPASRYLLAQNRRRSG
jgi:hypothetical protein